MRSIGLCAGLLVLAACSPKPEQQAAAKDTASATMAAGATAAPVSLMTLAGKWNMATKLTTSDSVILNFELVADSAGMTYNFPNQPAVAARVVAIGGDSIVTEAGPYASALRKGAQVTTNSVMHFQDGKLMGTTVAHYNTKGADSVLTLRTEGTRAQ
jgi:hypothetical protein